MTDWLAKLKAESAAATPGPWALEPVPGADTLRIGRYTINMGLESSDAALIATLGTIREELLAVVEAADNYTDDAEAARAFQCLCDALAALREKVGA